MVDATFVREVSALAVQGTRVELVEVNGATYFRDRNGSLVRLIRKDPAPTSLEFHTLQGFVDAIRLEDGRGPLVGFSVWVMNPYRVVLIGPVEGEDKARTVLLEATAQDPCDGFFDRFMPQEEMVVGLLTRFSPGGQRGDVLPVVSKLSQNVEAVAEDDGVSQRLAVKQGVSRLANVTLPNPVVLFPYRTFPEVTTVPHTLVLRVQEGRQSPQVALYEADGGQWKVGATLAIGAWLRERTALPVLA